MLLKMASFFPVFFIVITILQFIAGLDGLSANPEDNTAAEEKAKAKVLELCARFPIYEGLMEE